MSSTAEPLHVDRFRIAPELLSRGYARGCGPSACTSACCKRGAYVDLLERDRIFAHAQAVALQMDESQNRDPAAWFEPETRADSDYASGACVGTAEHGGKCTFLDRLGRCSLQVTEGALGARKWSLKPLYCALFPIEVCGGVVRLDPRLQGQEACCSVKSVFDVPAFEACREELTYLLGDAGFALLRRHDSEGTGCNLELQTSPAMSALRSRCSGAPWQGPTHAGPTPNASSTQHCEVVAPVAEYAAFPEKNRAR